jgi:staphylococcal nuclease domain-containing protein 1
LILQDPLPDDYEELVKLQEVAKSTRVGIWSEEKSAATRNVKWAGTFDASALFESCKNTPQPAIVEQFRDGASMRCYLLDQGVVVNVNLSGVKCARLGGGEGDAGGPEPFSREALLFSELRMLQRDCVIHLEGLDKTGNFFGTMEHPKVQTVTYFFSFHLSMLKQISIHRVIYL